MFPPELLPSWDRVLVKAHDNDSLDGGPPDWPPSYQRRDAGNLQAALRSIGHDVNLSDAYSVWALSQKIYSAGWIDGAENVEGALAGMASLCEDVVKGWDYAQISNDWE